MTERYFCSTLREPNLTQILIWVVNGCVKMVAPPQQFG